MIQHGAKTWKDTEYSWVDMFRSCSAGRITYITTLSQGVINTAILAMDFALLYLKKCNGAEAKTTLMSVTAASLGINTFFMAVCIFLKLRYYCCDAYSPLEEDRIKQEKCCYDTTITVSVAYILMNTVALVSCYFFCK